MIHSIAYSMGLKTFLVFLNFSTFYFFLFYVPYEADSNSTVNSGNHNTAALATGSSESAQATESWHRQSWSVEKTSSSSSANSPPKYSVLYMETSFSNYVIDGTSDQQTGDPTTVRTGTGKPVHKLNRRNIKAQVIRIRNKQ